jgi:hypothetical protein
LLDRGAPYAGFSAGAMIAPDRGIIGGWRPRRGVDLAVCPRTSPRTWRN